MHCFLGELTAHCMGPSLLAFCELYNHHDATFTLNVKPQEPGRHILEVKYGGLHVPSKYKGIHTLFSGYINCGVTSTYDHVSDSQKQ